MIDLARSRRLMLRRSVILLTLPVWILLSILACVGTALVDTPVYRCPTPIPLPTVDVPPDPNAPIALPTVAPTPYIITPPQDFYAGDAVFVGAVSSPQRVRFRLQNVVTYPADDAPDGSPRFVYAWQLEVHNAGSADYSIFPSIQTVLTDVLTPSGMVTGTWGASRAAALQAQVTLDGTHYTLPAGTTRTFQLAALAPAGVAHRFTFVMDPNVADDSPTFTWINQTNPYCAGDVSD
jgi:hypothetical protein